MKAVLLRKRKYSYKDVFRLLWNVSMHYILFYIYFAIIFSINLAVTGDFLIEFKGVTWLLMYPLIIGPGVNSILHIIYAESGLLWFRASMWFHTFFILIITPIVVFILAGN